MLVHTAIERNGGFFRSFLTVICYDILGLLREILKRFRALSQVIPKTYVFGVKHTYFDFFEIGPVTGIAEKNLKTYIP
jgi:hypothetical protein